MCNHWYRRLLKSTSGEQTHSTPLSLCLWSPSITTLATKVRQFQINSLFSILHSSTLAHECAVHFHFPIIGLVTIWDSFLNIIYCLQYYNQAHNYLSAVFSHLLGTKYPRNNPWRHFAMAFTGAYIPQEYTRKTNNGRIRK